jgi:hypothetical protein
MDDPNYLDGHHRPMPSSENFRVMTPEQVLGIAIANEVGRLLRAEREG